MRRRKAWKRLTLVVFCAVAGAGLAKGAPPWCYAPDAYGFQWCSVGTVNLPEWRPQEMSEWCWAASIQMVFLYHDPQAEIPQARIIYESIGRLEDAPGMDYALRGALNRIWTVGRQKLKIESKDWDFRQPHAPGQLVASVFAAVNELVNDNPVILVFRVGYFAAHAVVLYSMNYGQGPNGELVLGEVWVVDPEPNGARYRPLTPEEKDGVLRVLQVRVWSTARSKEK